MKSYVCDSCGRVVSDPYVKRIKEFYIDKDFLGSNEPFERKKRIKIHLCSECFRGLRCVAERIAREAFANEVSESGRWIKEYLGHGDYVYKCSCCGVRVGRSYIEDFGNRDYCSKCGAKMDKELVK